MKTTSAEIKKALSLKHSKDFFACEVKNGSTWFTAEYIKFDAIAIKKSWTKPCITIYEIKVSIADFKSDNKHYTYKKYGNEFYWAVPTGLIDIQDIPDNDGLIYFNKEKNSLRTIRKAVYKNIKYSADMLLYIIMNKIEADRYPFFNDKIEYFKAFLAAKEERKYLSYHLPETLRQMYQKALKEQQKIEDFAGVNKRLGLILETFSELKIRTWFNTKEDLISILKDFAENFNKKQISKKLLNKLEELNNNINWIIKQNKEV